MYLFGFDSATIAIWPASFDLIILSILHKTMAYAVSFHNNQDFVAELFIFSLILS
jgi:hypothetical protein